MHVNKVLIDKAVKSVGIVIEDHGNSGMESWFCFVTFWDFGFYVTQNYS